MNFEHKLLFDFKQLIGFEALIQIVKALEQREAFLGTSYFCKRKLLLGAAMFYLAMMISRKTETKYMKIIFV